MFKKLFSAINAGMVGAGRAERCNGHGLTASTRESPPTNIHLLQYFSVSFFFTWPILNEKNRARTLNSYINDMTKMVLELITFNLICVRL